MKETNHIGGFIKIIPFSMKVLFAKINQQTDRLFSQTQVVEQLRPVFRQNFADCLQLNDHFTTDNIHTIFFVEKFSFVIDRKFNFRFGINTIFFEFYTEGLVVYRLQEPGIQLTMHIKSSTDDFIDLIYIWL